MAQIYIANPTLQHRRFSYRVPERDRPRVLDVPAASQIVLDLNKFDAEVVKDVIAQLEAAGAVPHSEIHSIIKPRTLVYSTNKSAVNQDKLDEAQARDKDARQGVSTEQTQKAGLAILGAAEKSSGSGSIQSTSMEIKQVDDRGNVKGGVDVEIGVSRDAGAMRTGKKNG